MKLVLKIIVGISIGFTALYISDTFVSGWFGGCVYLTISYIIDEI